MGNYCHRCVWGSFLKPRSANGLINGGGWHPVLVQLLAVLVTYAFASGMTWFILKCVSLVIPLQASEEEQKNGLDLTQHGENAYPDFDLPENIYT